MSLNLDAINSPEWQEAATKNAEWVEQSLQRDAERETEQQEDAVNCRDDSHDEVVIKCIDTKNTKQNLDQNQVLK